MKVTLSVDSSRVRAGQFVPDHRVGGVTGGLLLGAVGPRRQDGVDDVQRDRAALLHAQCLQRIDDLVGGLAGDVGGDLVARRVQRGVAVHHQVGDAGIVPQRVDHRIADSAGAMTRKCSIFGTVVACGSGRRASNFARLSICRRPLLYCLLCCRVSPRGGFTLMKRRFTAAAVLLVAVGVAGCSSPPAALGTHDAKVIINGKATNALQPVTCSQTGQSWTIETTRQGARIHGDDRTG